MRTSWVLPVVAVVAIALGGCSQAAPADSAPLAAARASVEDLLHGVAYDRNDDIDFAARAVAELTATSGIRLIGIERVEAAALGDTFGTLELLVPETQVVDNSGVSRTGGPYCFRVGFDYYGATVVDDVVATESFDCPADAADVTPPPDTTVYPVIPENARDAVHTVLTQVAAGGDSPAAAEIVARIVQQLTPPASEFQTLALPDVVEDAGVIGVALQDSDECLLVKLADGAVTDVYPPSVLLQPGELGCSAGTAIADADQLQSPH